MDLAGTRALVTGGAGFIGSHLVDHLLSQSDVGEVLVLDNLATGRRENLVALGRDSRLALFEADVSDPATVQRACNGVQVVFHLACLGVRHSLHSPVQNHRVNAEGSLQLLLAAAREGVQRFVHVSSSEVFGTARYAPMDELHPTEPTTVYGAGKLAGEAYARAMFQTVGLPTVVIRPFNNYGPRSHFEGDSGEVIPRTIVRVLCNLPPIIFGDGEQTRDFVHVTDTARIIADLAECDAAVGQTVNLGTGQEIAIGRLADLISVTVGRPGLAPEYREARPGDVRRLCADASVARRLVGAQPRVSLAEGIRDLVEWFRSQPLSASQMLSQMVERNWEPGAEGASTAKRDRSPGVTS